VAKYDALREHLAGLPRGQTRLTMTFAQIEGLLGASARQAIPLPRPAYAHEEWWRGKTPWGRVERARPWEQVGWVVDDLSLRAKLVTFRRQT